MTDTIKRIAGPTQPAQTTAGTLLYTAGGSTVTAVKSALIHNTDPLLGAFFTMSIGSDLTDFSKRILSSYFVAPGDTAYVPLDLVLGNSETLYARQSCIIDPAMMSITAAAPVLNAGSGTFIETASWTEVVGDTFLLTVALFDASAVVSSFTDTHTGVTWTFLQSYVNAAGTARIYQYIAQSTGTTNTTTRVTFDSTCDSSALAIDVVHYTSLMRDSSGSNGETSWRAMGTGEAPPGTFPTFVAKDIGARLFNAHATGTAAETQTAMPGWVGVDNFGTTNAASIGTSYSTNPDAWTKPKIVTGSKLQVYAFAEVLNSKRSLVVMLNGVEVT